MIYLSNSQLRIDFGESGGKHVIPLNTIKNLISNYLERLYKQLSEVITNLANGKEVHGGVESGFGPGLWQCIIIIIVVILVGLFFIFTRLMGS